MLKILPIFPGIFLGLVTRCMKSVFTSNLLLQREHFRLLLASLSIYTVYAKIMIATCFNSIIIS